MPDETMIGSLIRFIVNNPLEVPQPMRANFGIIPQKFFKVKKSERKQTFIKASLRAIDAFRSEAGINAD
jgi:folate-dependent tRNA-U54 methylase TrmFO/GidA